MGIEHFMAKVKESRLIELPLEAERLQLKPGEQIEVRIDRINSEELQSGNSINNTVNPKSNHKSKTRRISAMGKYAGLLSSEEFMSWRIWNLLVGCVLVFLKDMENRYYANIL